MLGASCWVTVPNCVTRAVDAVFESASRNASAASRTWLTAPELCTDPDASSTSVRSSPHFSSISGLGSGTTCAAAGGVPRPATLTKKAEAMARTRGSRKRWPKGTSRILPQSRVQIGHAWAISARQCSGHPAHPDLTALFGLHAYAYSPNWLGGSEAVMPTDKPLTRNPERTKAGLFLLAFGVIGILTIIEGTNDGWTILNWIVLAVSIVFGAQSVLVLSKSRSSRT